MPRASSFTFSSYTVDAVRSTVTFSYRVDFSHGITQTFRDTLHLPDVPQDAWRRVPQAMLDSTLQALSLILGINYWCIFPSKNIHIEGFTLTREQAQFWDALYLNGLGEFFYEMQMDFRGLIAFPWEAAACAPAATRFALPSRALLLNGAGKDSILSAEMLKESGQPFDFFAFASTPAHARVAVLVGARTIRAYRRRDWRANFTSSLFSVSTAYPSVSTFTFVAVLLAELLGYDSLVFSNERSADYGNFMYRGLPVNHQWCKSSTAEQMTNSYIQQFITPSITARSLLREFSELEIVRRFVQYPQYLRCVTSCNNYFWLPRPVQRLRRKAYWCKRCPKCVFLFACFAAFLPKREVVAMFGGNLFADARLIPLFKSILGVEGFKPLDCVGEPEEMILAMHLASRTGEYTGEPAMRLFEKHFSPNHDFTTLERSVLA